MDEEQVEMKKDLIDHPGILLILSAIENVNSTNCNEMIQRPAKPSEIVINPSYTNQNSSDATPTHKKDIDIHDKNMLGKIKFGQKLKKTFLKTDQGFVLIEKTNSSSLPECSTVNQLNPEAINKSENVAPHEMSSMNCDTPDIAVHEEKMLTEGPEIQETNNSGKWCSICSYVFWKQSDLDEHVANVHEGKKLETYEHSQQDSENHKVVLPCYFCSEVFQTKNDRKEHTLISHDVEILENQETPTDSNTSENEENLFCSICPICSKIFQNKYNLDSHIVSTHQVKILKNFKCHICFKVFKTKDDINRHFVNDHSGKELDIHGTESECEKKFQCLICLKVSKTESDVTKHFSMVHGVNTANIQETHEKSNKIIKNSLKVKKVHEGKKQHEPSQKINVVKKNIQCSTCFKFFWTQQNLKEHFAIAHVGKKQQFLTQKVSDVKKSKVIHLKDLEKMRDKLYKHKM